jgi:glycosyltransferase involved in cell wall biosynthesis
LNSHVGRLRLVAIIEAYSITGPAKNLLEFARQARMEGVETTIVTFTRGASDNLFTSTVRDSGIPLEIVQERGAFDPRAVRSLAEIVRRIQPDAIQTHAVKSHLLARIAGLPRLAPWIAFHHGYTWPTAKARAYNQLDRWTLRAAKKVLTVSRPFRDELITFGVRSERIEIVHNAIPVGWGIEGRGSAASAELRASAGIPPERKVILIVGRLSREKDHLTLLNAVAWLRPDIEPHLVIVGEGPERPRIEQKVRELGLEANVTLTGQQSSAQPWYGIADLAVLSSLSEGSPNALLEAMAAGVAVVATEVGGIPEIVNAGESALLVRPGDVGEMESAMRRMFTEPGLAERMTRRSKELIAERHEPEARMRRLVSIYRSLID